jgi:site-specific DNA-cytosine methylase
MSLRYGSLFSGIGGIDLGLDAAGWECAWQVEIDAECRKILTKHWLHVPKYTDIRKCHARQPGSTYGGDIQELAPVDLLVGGFP